MVGISGMRAESVITDMAGSGAGAVIGKISAGVADKIIMG